MLAGRSGEEMKANGSLSGDRTAAAPSSFTAFHPHALNPFAAHGGAGQKRAADGTYVGNNPDGHHNNNGSGGNTSDAAVSSSSPPPRSSPTNPEAKRPKKPAAESTSAAAGGDGATIEVVRRPRGRPPGSKNKPKPPQALGAPAASAALLPDACGTDHAGAMRPHILEVPAGHDVAESLAAFSRRRDIGVSALAATGPVSNVTLRQPPHLAAPAAAAPPGAAGAAVTLHGRYDILSISATFFPPSFASAVPQLPPAAAGAVSVSLAGPHGQIVGGAVAGPLVAAGTVTVIAATFGCPSFHRLPLDDDLSISVSASNPAGDASSGGGGGGPAAGRAAGAPGDFHVDQAPPPAAAHQRHEYGHHHPQQQQHPQHQHQQHHSNNHQPAPQPEPVVTSLPISTSHLLSDVIWAPRDRRRPF